jgi:hypothetical protein
VSSSAKSLLNMIDLLTTENGLRSGTQATDAVLSAAKLQDALINQVTLCVAAQSALANRRYTASGLQNGCSTVMRN